MTIAFLPVTPSLRLDGKRALVTGAGRGIGLAAAAALATAGAHVTLISRTKNELDDAVAAIKAVGGSAEALAADVTNIDQFRDLINSQPVSEILVNNAGMNRPKPMIDLTVDDYDAVMGLNVKAAFFAAQAFVRRLVTADRPGSIINISSQMGHVGAENRTLYCASKWSIEGLTKAMAVEFGSRKIRVNTICPTFIETPMTRGFLSDADFRRQVLEKIKLKRLGRVDDVMGGIVFLASDASSLMTGSSLMLDGGWTAE
ncbi:MAG: SDR family oxidoreductase [Cryobacterium sp.]|nr:SDR family oxidoreductase [Cryobacterium sp.]MBX3521171.1 SDR family oxidoreductase [Xanthobacteraceae bacterium]MBX3549038.1 SDR family oxidoreductase [Xanthobacteraceae bacterium]MCW5675409.1 SDR family oxidoreductase [Xanthobacteraceae bacterium]MCW5676579.1 SDR family oxidoreductase [Xanthobacteraceae bacterium]